MLEEDTFANVGVAIQNKPRIDNRERMRNLSQRRDVFDRITSSNLVQRGEGLNYFNDKSGGYYITYNGHLYHGDEVEAAKILADNGFEVRLTSEQTSSITTPGGRFKEGKISRFWYEQMTPESTNEDVLKRSIEHAHDKNASIALIYDVDGRYDDRKIGRAIGRYIGQHRVSNNYPVKEILVVSKTTRTVKSYRIYK